MEQEKFGVKHTVGGLLLRVAPVAMIVVRIDAWESLHHAKAPRLAGPDPKPLASG